MKINISLLVLLLFCAAALSAQTRNLSVEGIVTDTAGMPLPAVFHVYPETPRAEFTVSLQPDAAAATSQLIVRDEALEPVPTSAEWPSTAVVDAGLYQVEVQTAAPYRPYKKLVNVKPPMTPHTARVTP